MGTVRLALCNSNADIYKLFEDYINKNFIYLFERV